MPPHTSESTDDGDPGVSVGTPHAERSETRQSRPAGRRRFLAGTAAVAVGLAGCTSSGDGGSDGDGGGKATRTPRGTETSQTSADPSTRTGDEWVTFQHDFQRTGYAPNNAPPSGPVTEQWRTVLPEGGGLHEQNGQPILAGGTLFTASPHRTDHAVTLYALDEETGEIVWQTTVQSPDNADFPSVDAAPTYHDGTVYYYTNYSQLIAVAAADGSINWQADITPTYRNQVNSPIVHEGTVYVTPDRPDSESDTAGIVGVDPGTGDEVWRYSDAPGVFSGDPDDDVENEGDASHFDNMALGEDTLYAASRGEGLYAVRPGADGERWEIPNSEDDPRWEIIEGSVLAFADDTVYLKAFGTFSAIDATNGDLAWSIDDGHQTNRSPYQVGCAVANGTVYYTTGATTEPNLRALDTADGALRWEQTTAEEYSAFMNSPVLAGAGETVFVSTEAGTVVALDAISGERLWNFRPEASAASVDPIVANGAIYFDYFAESSEEPVVVKVA